MSTDPGTLVISTILFAFTTQLGCAGLFGATHLPTMPADVDSEVQEFSAVVKATYEEKRPKERVERVIPTSSHWGWVGRDDAMGNDDGLGNVIEYRADYNLVVRKLNKENSCVLVEVMARRETPHARTVDVHAWSGSSIDCAVLDPESAPPRATADATEREEPQAPVAAADPEEPARAGSILAATVVGKPVRFTDNSLIVVPDHWQLNLQQDQRPGSGPGHGHTQLWIVGDGRPRVGKQLPAKLLFMQVNDGKIAARNITNGCNATGVVTFERVPRLPKRWPKSEAEVGNVDATVDVKVSCDPFLLGKRYGDFSVAGRIRQVQAVAQPERG